MYLSLQNLPRIIQLVYFLAIAWVLTSFFKYIPLADYTEWIHQSYILSELLRGDNPNFYIRNYPVPYVASQLMMAAMNTLVDPISSGKILIFIYLGLGFWFSKKFVERYQLSPTLAYPLLISCIICNSSFWSGYINYQFGLLVLMAYMTLSDENQSKAWIVALFSLLAFSCHGFCLVAFGVIAGVRACTQGFRAVCMFAIACLPAFILTVWYMVARSNDAMPPFQNPAPYFSAKFWAYKIYTLTKAGPYQNFFIGHHGDLSRTSALYYCGVLANVMIGLLILALQGRVVKHFFGAKYLHLSIAAGILGLAYIFSPALAAQVVNPGERLLYPQLLCVFAIGLRSFKVSPPLKTIRISAVGIYIFLIATVVSLILATQKDGYESNSTHAKINPEQAYLQIMYWHRPYQFKAIQDYIENRYQTKTPLDSRIIFPTSLVANTEKVAATKPMDLTP